MALLKTKYETRGLYSTRKLDNLQYADLLNEGEIENLFADFQPNVVVHCAAERRPDVVAQLPDKAYLLNVEVTKKIAEACQRNNAWLINLSTDYVFNGEKPKYKTDDTPDPLSDYGKQKQKGEEACLKACPSSATVRVPLLFGPIEYVKESAVTTLYLDLRKKNLIKEPDNLQKRYPTYTCDVAKVLGKMLEVHFSGKKLSGIYHWQADEELPMTKYDMMLQIAELFGLPDTDIKPGLTESRVRRPENSCLDCSKLVADLGIKAADYRTPFKKALEETFATFPRDAVVGDILAKMDGTMTVTKDQLERMLDTLKIPICHKEIQKLMNKDGKINKDDYDAFVSHLPCDGN